VTDANRPDCASFRAEEGFRRALDAYRQYNDVELVITTRNQLITPAALQQAQARKRTLLRQLEPQLRTVINTGIPEYLAAATFYLGLAQWEYGDYLRNIDIRVSGLTDEERAAVRRRAEQTAEQEFSRAREIWQALVDKAQQEEALRDDPEAQRWLRLTRDAINGNVPSTPPPPGGGEHQ
jgi:hypothetical protein